MAYESSLDDVAEDEAIAEVRQADALALARLIYDIYKEKNQKEQADAKYRDAAA